MPSPPHRHANARAATVTVIIVNWNGGPLLAQCVQHLQAQTVQPDQILLIDNASTDDSLQHLPAWGRLTVQRMDSNLGFAAANNQAITQCHTEYVALLNPDAFAAPDWLEQQLLQPVGGRTCTGVEQRHVLGLALGDGLGVCCRKAQAAVHALPREATPGGRVVER